MHAKHEEKHPGRRCGRLRGCITSVTTIVDSCCMRSMVTARMDQLSFAGQCPGPACDRFPRRQQRRRRRHPRGFAPDLSPTVRHDRGFLGALSWDWQAL